MLVRSRRPFGLDVRSLVRVRRRAGSRPESVVVARSHDRVVVVVLPRLASEWVDRVLGSLRLNTAYLCYLCHLLQILVPVSFVGEPGEFAMGILFQSTVLSATGLSTSSTPIHYYRSLLILFEPPSNDCSFVNELCLCLMSAGNRALVAGKSTPTPPNNAKRTIART